jgi:drug/metabolite transporter (DMT)-like permease
MALKTLKAARHPVSSARADRPLLGIGLKIVATFLFTMMFACVRWLGTDFPTGQVVFFRSAGALVPIVIAALIVGGWQLLGTRNLYQHAVRSLCGAGSMFCNFVAYKTLPIATATAIGYASPLFIVILAAILLREKVHIYRWSAVVAGFAGILVMIGPDVQMARHDDLIGASLILTGAALAAVAMIVLRRMSGQEHSITIAFYFSVTTAILGFATLLFGWNTPDLEGTTVLLLSGLFGGFGQLALCYSYRYAEASALAPFDYSSMVWAVMIGMMLFDELPGIHVWGGAAIVIAAGLLIFWREKRTGKQLAVAAQAEAQVVKAS